ALLGAEDDPVREKLDKAKAAYEAAMNEYQAGVGKWFEDEDNAARKAKSDVTDRVNRVAAESKLFKEFGLLPGRAPPALKDSPSRAATALIKAYKAASDEYIREKNDDEAAGIEQEVKQFHKRLNVENTPRELLGKWKVRVGPNFRTEWTFAADGTVTSTAGESQGVWRIDTQEDTAAVLIEWPAAKAWERLPLPLVPNKWTGVSSAGPRWKIEAVRIKKTIITK
ncbi:MAG TPA: hypothetical protein VL475_02515, partial [Planctomycetaceae bacterium]|nr:hypothetical protein [Planctomycetaceae bacterium]